MRSQTDQLREALIGSVSHELRTPLASILGAATVLSAAPAIAGEKKLRALAHDVRDEAERLNNDIQNLLDATRISSNGITPRVEWADPEDIINSAVERCRSRLADRRVVLDLPANLPLVRVDSVLVQQALVQVFDNAVKYSEPQSRITVSARAPDGQLIISIADAGRRHHGCRAIADLATFRPRRAPRRDHQRLRPRPVDRQCLRRRQWRHDQSRQRRPRSGLDGGDRTPGGARRRPATGNRQR